MGNCGGGAAFGIARLIDANNRFFRGSLPVYYVENNFDPTGQDYAEMGRMYVPTSPSGQALAGQNVTLVDPPVTVTNMTLKQMADASQMGVELRLGSKIFSFSNTWVQQIVTSRGYSTSRMVFNGPKVIGWMYDGLLHNFESFLHQDAYGVPLTWDIICTANEQR